MDQLHIPTATFYGCSSGGATVLALVANHPTRVQSGIVHEVPYTVPGMLAGLLDLSDSEIVETCGRIFSSDLCEDRAAFDALGEEYQSRLNGNYVTWVRNYDGTVPASLTFADEDLKRRPLTWTLGALTPTGAFFANVGVAQRLGVTIRLLPSKHFPQITIPEQLAEHIAESASTFL
jgi:pimeloyl-ACP methyl ester carboxylesterase